jgi:hypothetical protein
VDLPIRLLSQFSVGLLAFQAKNRANARNRLGPKHLKVSRFSIRLLREGSKEAMPVSRLCSVRGLKRAKYG